MNGLVFEITIAGMAISIETHTSRSSNVSLRTLFDAGRLT
jgi:hypothetical protein